MHLNKLDLTKARVIVFDGMDTIAPRGDRLQESREILAFLQNQERRQTVISDPAEYLTLASEGFEVLSPKGVSVHREAVERIRLAGLKVSDSRAVELFDGMTSLISTFLQPYPGARELILALQGAGKRVLLFSTAAQQGKIALHKSGICSQFDRTYFSVDIGHNKESTEGFNEIVAREHDLWGAQPSQFVLIDDKELHCEMARKAGWQSVLFLSHEGHAMRQRIEGKDNRHFEDLPLPCALTMTEIFGYLRLTSLT